MEQVAFTATVLASTFQTVLASAHQSKNGLQVEFTAEIIAAIFPNAHTGPAGC